MEFSVDIEFISDIDISHQTHFSIDKSEQPMTFLGCHNLHFAHFEKDINFAMWMEVGLQELSVHDEEACTVLNACRQNQIFGLETYKNDSSIQLKHLCG